MTTDCRYDRDTNEYLTPDGDKCDVPKTQHCHARKTCSQHLGWEELTCARCLGRTRTNLKRLVDLAALYLPAAVEAGRVDREAISLAGPVAHYGTWEWRHNRRKAEVLDAYPDNDTLLLKYLGRLAEEQDDENHPTLLLARWVLAFAEDYSLETPKQITLVSAADWLDRQLGKVAHDENQDWRLFASEVRNCVQHVEAVLSVRRVNERGVPCPDCVSEGKTDPRHVRLVRLYSHWCDDEDCPRIHVADDSQDVWRCPANREHQWSAVDYERYLTERRGA